MKTGATLSQSKELLEANKESWDRFFPRAFRGSLAPATPQCQNSNFQNCETVNFCCFTSFVCSTLLQQPYQTNSVPSLSPLHCTPHWILTWKPSMSQMGDKEVLPLSPLPLGLPGPLHPAMSTNIHTHRT